MDSDTPDASHGEEVDEAYEQYAATRRTMEQAITLLQDCVRENKELLNKISGLEQEKQPLIECLNRGVLRIEQHAKQRMPKWVKITIGVQSALVLAMGVLMVWQLRTPPHMSYARALGSIDATLMQHWGKLPKALQDALNNAYDHTGFTNPSDRLPKK